MSSNANGPLAWLFESLFSALEASDYVWESVAPERLQALRKSAAGYDPLVRYFGIGLADRLQEVREALLIAGFPEEGLAEIFRLHPSVTRVGDLFIPHSRWPADSSGPGGASGYVHLGPESLELGRRLAEVESRVRGARVLDLGSGSGVLSLMAARQQAGCVLGLEISERAVEWSNAAAAAQGIANTEFRRLSIGSPEAETAVSGEPWNLALSNPPLAVPSPGDRRPHRDGGQLGIELPLLFLDFAAKQLAPGGEAFFTVTNPIVNGRPAFFDRLDRKRWDIVEKTLLNDHFNASLQRKEGYAERGISRIELWFLRLAILPRLR
ncbi:MAG: methyltransferase domain-containing protein [Oligoflexia bacterium]|nr:methyltransferase domain-containing protein [Oligoflexia bacterium]